MIDNWVIDSRKHRVLVVMYEDLKDNERAEMKRMLNFLRLGSNGDNSIAGEGSSQTTSLRPLQNFTANFHRKHSRSEEPFDPFTPQQRSYVVSLIAQTQRRLQKHNMTSVLDVSRYLTRTSW